MVVCVCAVCCLALCGNSMHSASDQFRKVFDRIGSVCVVYDYCTCCVCTVCVCTVLCSVVLCCLVLCIDSMGSASDQLRKVADRTGSVCVVCVCVCV